MVLTDMYRTVHEDADIENGLEDMGAGKGKLG